MLDITRMLGAMPPRFAPCLKDAHPDLYFSLARGDARRNIPALEMTKWFDTNYHYLVPEIDADTPWHREEHPLVADTRLAGELGFSPKPALIGPFTWLALAKARNGAHKWARLDAVTAAYADLLRFLRPCATASRLRNPCSARNFCRKRRAGLFGRPTRP